MDIAKTIGLNQGLIRSDGKETTWPENSTPLIEKMKELGYPTLTYSHLLDMLKKDF